MLRRVVPVLAVAATIGVMAGSPAVADCMVDDRRIDEVLAEADIVFVGTVTDVRHDTTADFEVEESWKGDVPARVTVLGGPDEPGVATSVDRSWRPGARYLVVPSAGGGPLRDDQCSPTREWTDDLEEFRPATSVVPEPVASPGGPSQGTVMALAGVVLVLAVAATFIVVRPRDNGASGG